MYEFSVNAMCSESSVEHLIYMNYANCMCKQISHRMCSQEAGGPRNTASGFISLEMIHYHSFSASEHFINQLKINILKEKIPITDACHESCQMHHLILDVILQSNPTSRNMFQK